jgi:hypothetical protein
MMDNSGENNSGENSGEISAENSDSSNKAKLEVPPKAIATGGSSNAAHRNPASPGASPHHQNHHHGLKPPPPLDLGYKNAARERKIQDKKRKRMNMRREYEEKVEQEMESSEGSRDREVVIRPGKPVTLDKVLSFTKTPRLVVKAGPPFLIVYTNAAYSRLSGIDSHHAVGKTITSLLTLPDQEELMQVDPEKGPPALENSTVKAAETPEETAGKKENNIESSQTTQGGSPSTSENYASAEAAGRARAEASRGDGTELGLERLIAASGFSRIHMIHVRSKPHHMLGRNVKVFKPAASIKRNQEEGSNGSSMTSSYDSPNQVVACTMSISPVVSSPEAYSATVVTDREKGEHHHHHKHARSDKDQDSSHQYKAKRRKHHHHHQHGDGHVEKQEYYFSISPNEIPKRQLITHYVIQLDAFDGDFRKLGGMESPSSVSTTLEATMLGMTIAEVRRHRMNKAPSLQRPATSREVEPQPNPNNQDQGNFEDEDEEMESEDVSEAQQHVSAIG